MLMTHSETDRTPTVSGPPSQLDLRALPQLHALHGPTWDSKAPARQGLHHCTVPCFTLLYADTDPKHGSAVCNAAREEPRRGELCADPWHCPNVVSSHEHHQGSATGTQLGPSPRAHQDPARTSFPSTKEGTAHKQNQESRKKFGQFQH